MKKIIDVKEEVLFLIKDKAKEKGVTAKKYIEDIIEENVSGDTDLAREILDDKEQPFRAAEKYFLETIESLMKNQPIKKDSYFLDHLIFFKSIIQMMIDNQKTT